MYLIVETLFVLCLLSSNDKFYIHSGESLEYYIIIIIIIITTTTTRTEYFPNRYQKRYWLNEIIGSHQHHSWKFH